MSWTTNDENELQECINKIKKAFDELKSKTTPIEKILGIARSIQTNTSIDYTDKNKPKIIEIKPKDRWNNIMADEEKLQIKKECIDKTNKLLSISD